MRSTASIKTGVCMVLTFLAISISAFAQGNGIQELTNGNAAEGNSTEEFYDLVQKLHPTVYIKKGAVKKVYGEGSIVKMTFEDATSLSRLSSFASKYQNIELITISLTTSNDLNGTVDLSSISSLNSLKYVFIKCRFNCNVARLNQFINRNPNIRVFYLCGESE